MIEVLIGLVALAFPFAAIIGLVMAVGTRDRVRTIELQFAALERRLAGVPLDGAAAAAPRPSPAPEPRPTTESTTPLSPERAEPGSEQAQPAAGPLEPETATSAPTDEPAGAASKTKQPPEVQAGAAEAPARPGTAVPPVPPVPPATAAPPREMGFEERFGTQWVVWVGGLAIALGGFFLVRFSIRQDLLGPGVRIALGALLALALIALGEWARRSENLSGLTGLPSAHIPSILTAAGTTVAYADVYAAYLLYDMLVPATAFVLLGLVALLTLAAALLHGPALAGLGLVGAYVTPILVSSGQADYWSLYIYLAVVTAAAFGLARLRLWRWLAMTATGFAVLWTLPGLADNVSALGAHLFHVAAGLGLAMMLIVSGLFYGPDARRGEIDAVSSTALTVYLLAAGLVVLASRHDVMALAVFAALVGVTFAVAWRTEAATGAVPAAAVLVALVFAQWSVNIPLEHLLLPSGTTAPAIPDPERVFYGTHLLLGAAFAVLFGGAGFLAQGRGEHPVAPMLWSASAVFAPVAILVALYYRITGFDQSLPFAGVALLLAALFALATEALGRGAPRPGTAASGAIFATGAVAALALAFTMALEKGWLTVALALMVPGVAWIAQHRPLPALRILAAVLTALVLARIGWEPRIVGRDVGTTPIFNWILYGYGIPAAAFWLAGRLMRRRADDGPARVIDGAAILFTVLLAVLEIRHYVTGGDVYVASSTLAELGLQVSVGLAMTIGLERLRHRTRSIVHNVGALVIAALTLVAIVVGLGFVGNPLLWSDNVGGLVFNLILIGYALPAVLAAILALVTRGVRPPAYSAAAAVVAVVLALGYLTLEVTRVFHGPILTRGPTTDAEQYTYSAVWLLFGVALLAAGIWLRSQPVRFASAAVVLLTVCKVFLFDLYGLGDIYQSLSFIGLGIVLLGIGWFYQRLLFPRTMPSAPAPSGQGVQGGL